MQINKIQINGFGKLINKTYDFHEGINLIVDDNESGKSTLVSFIKAMFYGINRNKDGNEYSEFELYKPWNEEANFSGTIEYTFNDENFMLQRNFSNNQAKIYDKDSNDISDKYNKNKSRGLEIGYEQLGIDEETFINSIIIKQNMMQVKLDSQTSLIQKVTNIAESGDENQSYEQIKKRIEKILYDEVGTERTLTKPKSICKREIAELEIKRDALIKNKNRLDEIENQKENIIEDLNKTKNDLNDVLEVYKIKDKFEEEIKKEKVIYDLEQKTKAENAEKRKKEIKTKKIIDTIIIALATIALVTAFIIVKEIPYAITALLIGVVAVIVNYKVSYKEEIEVESSSFDLVCEDIKKKQSKDLKNLSNKDNKYIDKKISELRIEKEELEKRINYYELENHKLKIEEESLKENKESFKDITEQLNLKNEELNEIIEKEDALNIALDGLSNAFDELKKDIIPELVEKIKRSIKETTDGKYDDIIFSGSQGLMFRNTNGSLEKINKLSQGTIDQIYLGFRLSISNEYETLPLIFDESFVFFDDTRLKNIISLLNKLAEKRQIIILSCSDREKRILRKYDLDLIWFLL